MGNTHLAAFIFFVSALFFCAHISLANTSPAAGNCVKGTHNGDASTYNPNFAGWKTGGQGLATGGTYNPNEYEAALQLDLARKYRCGYGSKAICHAVVQGGGKAMIVKINDNGPLVPGRIIDLNEKSMRYMSDGKYGKNSGVLKGVTVTVLCGVTGMQLGPLNEADREKWKNEMYNATPFSGSSAVGSGSTAPGAFANGAAPGAFANGAAPGAFGGGSGGGSGSGSGSSGSGSGSSGGGSSGGSPSAFSPFGNPYTQQPMLGLTQPQPQTSQSPFVVTESSEGGTISSSGVATISCANRRVRFSCGAPATSSRGISSPVDSAFKTRGAMVGALRVAPATKTTYTVQCIRSQRIIDEASCAMQPNKTVDPTITEHSDMVLTISADPQIIRRGKKTTITWSSIGAKQCTVYGYGLAGNGTDGEEQTDALQRIGSYEYVLECVHKDGSRVQEVETVIVK